MLGCLSKTPSCSNKKLSGQLQGRGKDRWGWQAEKIGRKSDLGGEDEGVGNKGSVTQPHSQMWNKKKRKGVQK